jgi:hypothetical protein
MVRFLDELFFDSSGIDYPPTQFLSGLSFLLTLASSMCPNLRKLILLFSSGPLMILEVSGLKV